MRQFARSLAATFLLVGLVACSGESLDTGRTRTEHTPSPTPTTTPTITPTPTTKPKAVEPSPTPDVVRRTVTDTRSIPFTVERVRDSSLEQGSREVRTRGVDGVRTLTYRVTLVDGERTSKRLISTKLTRRPVTEVLAIGTKPRVEHRCDPNYGGGCVPIASDVDCAEGSGDGPEYVAGPVRILGADPYDLDSDSDGFGCED